jgi:serine/threonine protein kinase
MVPLLALVFGPRHAPVWGGKEEARYHASAVMLLQVRSERTTNGRHVFQPTTFGKYFITGRIAVGGMAEVFSAKLYGADGFEKDLVIKQILPQYAKDPEFVQSFVGEAKIAVTLNHANIVGIYELGRVHGTYFIAMEYVDGMDAFMLLDAARKAQRQLDVGCALYILEGVSRGLDYAHRKCDGDGRPLGLVHRDLNPRNVLVSREGEVKILDFGIAKTAATIDAMPKTRAGVVKGTTGYMSPEQATGREIDARTDVYQSGLLLHELLTGQALFWRPDDIETRDRMRRHDIIRPSSLNPNVPGEVDEIVLRALAKKADQRFQTAQDLQNAVTRARLEYFPRQDARELGTLVAQLLDDKARAAKKIEQDWPETLELSEIISQTLKADDSGFETIATRGVSGFESEPAPKPEAGSRPLQVHERSGPGSRQPELPQPNSLSDLLLESQDVPDASGRPKRSGSAIIVLGTVLAGAAAAWLIFQSPDKPAAAQKPSGPSVATSEIQPEGTNRNAVRERPPSAESPVPAPSNKSSDPKIPATKAPKPTANPSVVAFGTRSCSGRVTVDGVVLSETTPSFNHRLTPGEHEIVLEGTSCAPVERPGSLGRSIPRVRKVVQIPEGVSAKVIADFDRNSIVVRSD